MSNLPITSDLGGYLPFAYEITPWTTLFPELSTSIPKNTLSNIYIAKIYTYYLTRLQFKQYLSFISDIELEMENNREYNLDSIGWGGRKIKRNSSINNDVANYEAYCDELYIDIKEQLNALNNRGINNETYNSIIKNFEYKLQNKSKNLQFFSIKPYKVFFENYEFFTDNNYGFIEVCNNMYRIDTFAFPSYMLLDGNKASQWKWTPGPKDFKNIPEPFSFFPMLKDAKRQYPFIDNNGDVFWITFDGIHEDWVLCDAYDYDQLKMYTANKTKIGEANYIEVNSITPGYTRKLYGINSKVIGKNYTGYIRGCPMIYDLPFEFFNSFIDIARGNE